MTSRVELPPEPQSASKARRFTREVLAEWREDEAADLVELLVSELVTNAVLHAGSELSLSLRRTTGRLRIEVGDGSSSTPLPRQASATATLGRGLDLVEALAESWGVSVRAAGKVVWFEVVAAGDAVDQDAEPELPPAAPPRPTGTRLQLQRVPVRLFTAMEEHTAALLREYALVRMDAVPGAWQPAGLPVDLHTVLADLRLAAQSGSTEADVTVLAPDTAAEAIGRAVEVLAEADALADEGRLLVGPALPEILACRQWLLAELLGQFSGLEPSPWAGLEAERSSVDLGHDVDHATVLATLATPVVAADDANRITFANRAAEALLGWDEGGLAGQRLTAVIPPRLHEAHVAGYTRFLLTRVPRILGEAVQVPAMRRDGTEVEVELVLAQGTGAGGRPVFVGSLQPARAAEDVEFAGHDLLGSVAELLVGTGAADLVPEVLVKLCGDLGATFGGWWIPDSAGDLMCVQSWAERPAAVEAFAAATTSQRFGAGQGLPGRVLESRTVVWLTDVVGAANFPRAAFALEAGLRTGVAFPVLRGSAVVGVMELFFPTVTRSQPELLATLDKVGRLLGMYLGK